MCYQESESCFFFLVSLKQECQTYDPWAKTGTLAGGFNPACLMNFVKKIKNKNTLPVQGNYISLIIDEKKCYNHI